MAFALIVRKTWLRESQDWPRGRNSSPTFYRDIYRGWFLLGFLPLYVSRERIVK